MMVSQSARRRRVRRPSSGATLHRISPASASPCSSGNIGSAVPWITRVGTVIEDRGSREHRPRRQQAVVLRRPRCCARARRRGGRARGSQPRRTGVASGEDARVADQVLDHRLAVRPVHLAVATKRRNSLGRRREPAFAGRRGRGADEDEREDAIGEVEREQLRERTARRDADHVRGRDPVGVEHTGGVGDQVGAGVLGVSRLIGDRSARCRGGRSGSRTARLGEHPAEALLPPEHRRADAHDKQDRRVGRVAEGLRAELDAVRFDHPLGDPCLLPAFGDQSSRAEPHRRWRAIQANEEPRCEASVHQCPGR